MTAGSDAMVCVLNERGNVLEVYPHPGLPGPVVLAAYCPNALEIVREAFGPAGHSYAGSCGLADDAATEEGRNGVAGVGAQCEWESEGHRSPGSVHALHAEHVARSHAPRAPEVGVADPRHTCPAIEPGSDICMHRTAPVTGGKAMPFGR